MPRLICCISARSAQHDSAIREYLRPSTVIHDHFCRHDITKYCEAIICRTVLVAMALSSPAPCPGKQEHAAQQEGQARPAALPLTAPVLPPISEHELQQLVDTIADSRHASHVMLAYSDPLSPGAACI